MAYRPTEATFGPPFRVRLPSIVYLALALLVAGLVWLGQASPSDSWLFRYVVEMDVGRLISATTFAGLLLVGALASLLRAGMRGVRIRRDGVEYRDVVQLFWPRSRFYKWAQIDTVRLNPEGRITLDLWDGTQAWLPEVRDASGLRSKLEIVATARAIPITGGVGLDEIPEPDENDEA